jgi:proteasome lid subunit RPN8/RPN11
VSALRVPRSLLADIVDHARSEAPNECCGMLAAVDGRAVQVHRARNEPPSPLRYVVHPADLHRILTTIEDAGQDLVIYHSHTRSDPVPSQTDINLAGNYPGAVHVIVGVKGPEDDVRAWTIDGDRVEQVELVVE